MVAEVQVLGFFLRLDILLSLCFFSSRDGLDRLNGGQLCSRQLLCRGAALHVLNLLLQFAHLAPHIVDVAAQFEEDLVKDLALALERVVAAFGTDGGQLRALLVVGDELAQHLGGDEPFLAEHGDLLGDVLQLTDVARPLVAHEQLLGLVAEGDTVHLVLLGYLHGKQAEQQYDVLAALAQRRNLYGHLVQTVVEVLAEAPLTDGLPNVHVRGGDDAHVGLADLGGTHGDVLAVLQHTQQACLSGQRQLAHLVEEEGALVGRSKVAQRVVDSSCVRALNMSEKLAVDGSFGNGAAVDGEVLLATAR